MILTKPLKALIVTKNDLEKDDTLFDPEAKKESKQCKHRSSPPPKKFKVKQP